MKNTPIITSEKREEEHRQRVENLRDDLENRGPVKLSEVEFEQQKILNIARRLFGEGQVSISASEGEDEAYV